MAVISENGITVDTLDEAIINNTALYGQQTGDVDVAPSNAAGEIVAITSEMDTRTQQSIAEGFTQNTIAGADGYNLDGIALIKNQDRREDQNSVVYVKLIGVNGTAVPAGTEFVCSTNDEVFTSDYAATIASGEAYVSATSNNVAVVCLANTISLKVAIPDISSATNETDAETGFDFEPDSVLRDRLQTIGTQFTNNLKEGLYLALTQIKNVSKVAILDNNTDASIDGVLARHFSPVVLGGNRAEIAKTIFRYMGVGNPSFGDVSQLVTSEIYPDLLYTVAFNVPSEVLVTITATLSTNADFDVSTGNDQVKENIVTYMNSLKIGEDLILQKVASVCLIQGVTSVVVTLNGSSVNLISTFKELYVSNFDEVTVS